jgi:hypothetical protein
MAEDPDSGGYWLVASDGGVFAFRGAPFEGSMGGRPLERPVVGTAATSEGDGYWEVASDGGLFSFNAQFEGSEGGQRLDSPIVGMAAAVAVESRPTVGLAPSGTGAGSGYWTLAADGTVSPFGAAPHVVPVGGGDGNEVDIVPTPDGGGYYAVDDQGCVATGGDAIFDGRVCFGPLDQPIVGLIVNEAAPAGQTGYRLVAADGALFDFGDAPYEGSLPGLGDVVTDIVGAAGTPDGLGYWDVGADGTVYPFGDAVGHGNWVGGGDDDIVGMAPTHDGGGYWLVDSLGQVEPFGDAVDYGSPAAPTDDVTSITATPDGDGYWLTSSDGNVYPEGDAVNDGSTYGLS